ncbi:branched-chain amino acid ABC transporter permease [Thermodesulfobacteriota bacterium]
MNYDQLISQIIIGVTLGGMYALIAVGYTMVYGIISLINFAHGEIYMLGAFIAFTLVGSYGVPFYLAFFLSMAICAFIGVAIEFIAYRPLRRAPRLAALITAIGMSLFLQNIAAILWTSKKQSFPRGTIPEYFANTAIAIGDFNITWMHIFIFAVTVSMMIGLSLLIKKTKIGIAMRASAQDKVMSSLLGVNPNRVISMTFAIGSAMGAAAGIISGVFYNAIYPTMGYHAGVKAFAAAVLGGIGSIPGAMVGGFVLGIGETLGSAYVSSSYRHGIAYLLMILIIIFKPSGLMGNAKKEKV